MTKPVFEHRHYKEMARILAKLGVQEPTVKAIADELVWTNPNFDHARFVAAAMGRPSNGRDRT